MMPAYNRQMTTAQGSHRNASIASVESILARSRQRSLEIHRLDPERGQARVLTAGAVREHRDPLESLLSVARSGMQALYQQIRDVGYVVLLTDAQGVAVEFITNPSIEREARRAGLTQGGCWTEDQEGTCAVGLALIDQLPMTVHHLEHFRTTNRALTCSASPIFAGDGSLIAVLDASALESPNDRRSQHLVLKMVDATSRMIGDAYFLRQYQNQLVLRTSGRRDFLEITTDGLLAFDAGGHVIGVNQQFQYDYGQSRDSLLGIHVQELFGVNYESLITTVDRNDPIQLRLMKSGSQCFALARAPRRPSVAHSVRTRGVVQRSPESRLTALAGFDAKMHTNVQKALRVMDKGVTVLLQGESGTGKEEFAKAMHEASQRAGAPFVALNCSAIPETLIESELFGYSEGAFTGARAKGAKGKIVQAHHGTLFLDEIGDMPLALQSRLLRVLAEREVVPLGAERAIGVDFQLICATHRDLLKLVEAGQFRLDLCYRLNGLTLTLPALRERTDLTALIDIILTQEAAASASSSDLSADARTLLLGYSWPGNIRQLKNALRSALALCDDGLIEVEHLPEEISASVAPVFPPQKLFSTGWSPTPSVANDTRPVAEEVALLQALKEHNWNISDAARSLNLNRSTVYRRMATHKIIQPNNR